MTVSVSVSKVSRASQSYVLVDIVPVPVGRRESAFDPPIIRPDFTHRELTGSTPSQNHFFRSRGAESVTTQSTRAPLCLDQRCAPSLWCRVGGPARVDRQAMRPTRSLQLGACRPAACRCGPVGRSGAPGGAGRGLLGAAAG